MKVLLEGGAGNEDVIKIYKGKGKILENVIHEALEGLGSIAETIRHEEVFIKAKRSDDSCFRNVRRSNWYLMIGLHQIQFGENSSGMEAGCEILEVRKRIAVGSSGKIKAAVIAAGSPGTVRFRDKVEGGGPGAVGTANDASRL